LQNPSADWDHPAITTLGHNHYSIRKSDWHYINYDGKEEELYNLTEDPEEWNNLAGEASLENIKQQLKALIPTERHELVPTDPLRWADVLSGKIEFYQE